jgi:oligoendopeptidase F
MLSLVFAFSQTRILSQTRERSEIPPEYKWKLEDLYPSDQAWNQAKEELTAQFDQVTKYKGKQFQGNLDGYIVTPR